MRAGKSVLLWAWILLALAADASAEVFVRWDQDRIPPPESLGISTVAVPARNGSLVRDALARGYRLLLEVDGARLHALAPPVQRLAGIIVSGSVPDAEILQLQKRFGGAGVPIFTAEARGTWPHIRTNWVTKNNDVLQVTRSSAQPWIESNAALVRIAAASKPQRRSLLTYVWKPATLADADEGPTLHDYLVAIADAASVGGDLLLPVHGRFQQRLLMGDPQTRLQWSTIRRHIEFVSWDLPKRYRPVANVAIVTAEPSQSFEALNLLLRHNVPFEVVAPEALTGRTLDGFDLVLVLQSLPPAQFVAATDFARQGGTLVIGQPASIPPWRKEEPLTKTDRRATYRFEKGTVVELLGAIADPDAFALDVRHLLGPDRRVLDIWNGITVLAFPYEDPDSKSMLVTAVNYAHQPLPVQLRVRGTFSTVHYESPEEPLTLLPYQHRKGYTEFVIPALRVGGRVFLGN